jgi:hypothetical protein
VAESGLMSLNDQLHRYGFIQSISVGPVIFGKQADQQQTCWRLRQWCQANLKDLWDLKAVKLALWTRDCGYIEITCMSKDESEKVRDYFTSKS